MTLFEPVFECRNYDKPEKPKDEKEWLMSVVRTEVRRLSSPPPRPKAVVVPIARHEPHRDGR